MVATAIGRPINILFYNNVLALLRGGAFSWLCVKVAGRDAMHFGRRVRGVRAWHCVLAAALLEAR